MTVLRSFLFALTLLLCACGRTDTPETKSATSGTSSCSATSASGKSCKVSCTSPQAAVCDRGTGAEPSCVCK